MARPADNHENKKRELLLIAESIFLIKGYEQTSIADILKESGISKGGFYHYFSSKEDILSESISKIIDESIEYLKPVIEDKNIDALEKFKLFMIKKSEFQKERIEYAKLLSSILQSDISQYKYTSIASHKMVEPLSKIIEQGISEGVFSVAYPRETADILIRSIISVVQSPFYEEYMTDRSINRKYLISLKDIVAKTLGISSSDFSIYDEDVED